MFASIIPDLATSPPGSLRVRPAAACACSWRSFPGRDGWSRGGAIDAGVFGVRPSPASAPPPPQRLADFPGTPHLAPTRGRDRRAHRLGPAPMACASASPGAAARVARTRRAVAVHGPAGPGPRPARLRVRQPAVRRRTEEPAEANGRRAQPIRSFPTAEIDDSRSSPAWCAISISSSRVQDRPGPP